MGRLKGKRGWLLPVDPPKKMFPVKCCRLRTKTTINPPPSLSFRVASRSLLPPQVPQTTECWRKTRRLCFKVERESYPEWERDRGSKSKKERDEAKRHPSVRALTQCLREMWAARLRTVTYFSYDVLHDIAALANRRAQNQGRSSGESGRAREGGEAGGASERETLK